MHHREPFSTTTFRWTLALAIAFAAFAVVVFAFTFTLTSQSEAERVDGDIATEIAAIRRPGVSPVTAIDDWLRLDRHRRFFASVFGPGGTYLTGNVVAIPVAVPDASPRNIPIVRFGDRRRVVDTMRGGVITLPGGRTLVIGADLDAGERTREDLARAIALAVVPAFALAAALAIYLARRSTRRVRAIEELLDRVGRGDLAGRLPMGRRHDDLERIAAGVNRMLDELAELMERLGGVGNDIAHDLRTPLGRVRAQLERGREGMANPEVSRAMIDRAIAGIDQALGVVNAILRIGEVENGARARSFTRVDFAEIARSAADLYAPIAEDVPIRLDVEAVEDAPAVGDRDLLFEAMANLVDNAVKFSTAGGSVVVGAGVRDGAAVMWVRDRGPGIAPAERATVLGRFVRGDKSRHVPGSGLGLSLVASVTRLHGFELTIDDASPGCRVTIRASAAIAAPVAAH